MPAIKIIIAVVTSLPSLVKAAMDLFSFFKKPGDEHCAKETKK